MDWGAVRDLRDLFLPGMPLPESYWVSRRQLDAYDRTLGERIGWKWDAVTRELRARGWSPLAGPLMDFGCGTGRAARAVLAAFPDSPWTRVSLYDRSDLATRDAVRRVTEAHPHVPVREGGADDRFAGTVLLSHLITELPDRALAALVERLPRADAVIWVEPGTHATARRLGEVREILRERFHLIAPCTHQGGCGMFTEANAAHWCHHFADAPPGVHQDPFWRRFCDELHLDLSAVAYSFLVFDKRPPTEPAGRSRLIGKPIFAPKFMRVLNCDEDGVRELVISRRAGAGLYKAIKKRSGVGVYEFEIRKNRIVGGKRVGELGSGM